MEKNVSMLYVDRRIYEMEVGEKAYTNPMACVFNREDIPYLYTDMKVTGKPCGLSSMPITRIGKGKADFEIDLDYQYFGGKYHKITLDKLSSIFQELDLSRLARLSPKNLKAKNYLKQREIDAIGERFGLVL